MRTQTVLMMTMTVMQMCRYTVILIGCKEEKVEKVDVTNQLIKQIVCSASTYLSPAVVNL